MIGTFTGAFRFLSNFWAEPGLAERLWGYPTMEHYYQAMKLTNLDHRAQIRALPGTHEGCKQAKRLGNQLFLRPGWDDMKFDVMRVGLEHKFTAGTELAERLLDTGNEELVEGNFWHDNIWGSCYCNRCKSKGSNRLGKLLMGQRYTLLTGGDPNP
jgi:ribA/ribD-fused uncharacterized protein